MAKIEMDISEYESMKEYKKLLEDSLKNEKELSSKIILLEKEKNKALEDSKMKVIKISKSESTQHLLYRKDIKEIIPIIFRSLNLPTDTQFIRERIGIDINSGYIDSLFEMCFSKITSHSVPVADSYETVGLDEIKNELKTILKAELDEEVASKLGFFDSLQKTNNELYSKIDELKREVYVLTKDSGLVIAQNNRLTEDNNGLNKENDSLVCYANAVNILLNHKFNPFNAYYKIKKVKEYIKSVIS